MNIITAIVFGILGLAVMMMLGAILFATFFQKKADAQDYMEQFAQKHGGSMSLAIPGRPMAEIQSAYGKIRVGYWLYRGHGENMPSPHLHVRIQSSRPFFKSDFWIQNAFPGQAQIHGFKQVPDSALGPKFLLFVRPDVMDVDARILAEKLRPMLYDLLPQSPSLEVSYSNHVLSVNYKVFVDNIQTIENFVQNTTELVDKLQH